MVKFVYVLIMTNMIMALYSYTYMYTGTPPYYSVLADRLVDCIDKKRAIVYTDFVKDVAPLAIALRERGISSWSYHGKNMSSHDKVKAVDNWCPEDSSIQVNLCWTLLLYIV